MSSTSKYNPGIVGSIGKSWSQSIEKKSDFGASFSQAQAKLTQNQQQSQNEKPQTTKVKKETK